MTTQETIAKTIESWQAEEAKFAKGNQSAGTRARGHLADLMKLAKARRVEIQSAKIAAKAE